MTPYARNILIAVVVLVVLIVAATVWYMKKYTVKLDINAMQVLSDGAVTLTAPLPAGAASDASQWVGLKIRISSKALGTIESVVGAVSPTSSTVSVSTIPGAYTGKAPYHPSAGDSARIYLRKVPAK